MRVSTRLLSMMLVASTAAVCAAPLKPIVQWHVKAAPKAVRAGARFDVTITGDLDPGWHLYALEEPEDGPIATEIALTEGDPVDLIRVEEDEPKMVPDPLFKKPTGYFDHAANFTLHLQADKNAKTGSNQLRVLIRYQSCNDHVCLPPHTDTVSIPLTIGR